MFDIILSSTLRSPTWILTLRLTNQNFIYIAHFSIHATCPFHPMLLELMDIRETGWEGVDWIHLVQDRDQWQTLVNMIINFQVP
jgi:hypothetical protein